MIRSEAVDPRTSSRRGASRVAFLVALPVVLEAVLAWRLLGPLEHTLFPDDAFYYLCVGRNIADGLGPTFDGVHATTGFQPLWQAIVALIALGPFGPSALTSAVAAVNLACLAVALTIVAVAFRRRGLRPGIWTLVVVVAFANPYLLKTSLNGMESGLVWLFWSLAMVVLARLLEGRTGAVDAAIAGAVAGGVMLTRLDGIGLVFALAWVTMQTSEPRRFRGIVSFAIAACVVAGPYFAWMWVRFGHWLPVSVLVKSGLMETRLPEVAVLGALFAAAIAFVTHRARGAVARLQPAPAAAALATLAGLLPLAVYAIVHRVRLTHLWYYPAVLTGLLVLASLIASALWARRRRGLVVAGAIAALALAAGVWTLRLVVHRGDEHYRVADAMGRQLQTLPADVRVAGWNVGLVAYRRSCRITNLDGLVNSYDYLEVLRENRVAAWLDREDITGLVEYFDGDPLVELAGRDPSLPGRVSERFRMAFDYVGPLTLSGSPRRRVYIYFDYRPANPPTVARSTVRAAGSARQP
jgi:hypothetical protein